MKRFIILTILLCLAFAGNCFAAAGLTDTALVSTSSGSQYPKTAYITATTNGDNTVVAAVTGKRIVVWHFEVSASAVAAVYWKSGASKITSTIYLDQYGGWTRETLPVSGTCTPPLRTLADEALILNSNTTSPVGVWVKYTEE